MGRNYGGPKRHYKRQVLCWVSKDAEDNSIWIEGKEVCEACSEAPGTELRDLARF